MCSACYSRTRYAEDPVHRAKVREYSRKWNTEKYANDPEYRAKMRANAKSQCAKRRPKEKERKREKYCAFPPGLFAGLMAHQNSTCAICPRTVIDRRGHDGAYPDHCHASFTPRGILCGICNSSLGFYERYQKPAGLVLEPYENYLANPPARKLTHE